MPRTVRSLSISLAICMMAVLSLSAQQMNPTPNRQPGLRKHRVPTLDASLLKTTTFGERYRMQFGFEAFNAINKYYFGRNDNFNTNPNDANFGLLFPSLTSNQNFSPRTMQVRLKFLW